MPSSAFSLIIHPRSSRRDYSQFGWARSVKEIAIAKPGSSMGASHWEVRVYYDVEQHLESKVVVTAVGVKENRVRIGGEIIDL